MLSLAPPRPQPAGHSPHVARSLRLIAAVLLAALGGSLGGLRAAQAAAEPRVESSTTTLELEADGSATVRHELMLSVRRGPLRDVLIRGVDRDAEPLPDATLTRISGSQAAGSPEPVEVRASGGQLELHVPQRSGLRGNRFLLRVGYRTRLLEGGALVHLNDRSELRWAGPRFDDGVDSVTLLLRTGPGRSAPEVAAAPSGLGSSHGIIMSTLRRSRDRDELELVRAHVARDESMVWRVALDPGLFTSVAEQAPEAAPGVRGPSEEAPLAPPARRGPGLPWLLAAGAAYGLLVQLKARGVARAARARDATPRAYVDWPAPWRALGAGLAFAAACAAVSWGRPPLLAAAALLAAMGLAAHQPPQQALRLRGPGHWQPLESSALDAKPAPSLPGAWLDAGRARGFVLLVAALGGVLYAALRTFEASPYRGAGVLLAGGALLPIFCTGRAGEMPLDALCQSRRFLAAVAHRIAGDDSLMARPIGRLAAVSGELDELRLSIETTRVVPGLLGVELALELRERLGGYSARPVVVVRAAEGSPCQRALPRGLTWMRGRSADERATLVRPKLPSPDLTAALVQELFSLWLEPASGETPVKTASKSAGRELSTANAGTRPSPAHAT